MQNDYICVVLSSVTYAGRVQRLCERQGITCGMGHTPKAIKKKGCSFMVKVRQKDLRTVLDIIDGLQLKIYGIYKKGENGQYDVLG